MLIALLPAVCEYFVHVECQDFAVADCKENATYLPGKDLSAVRHTHHWREGNLPGSSKCAVCKKSCFTAECLAGFRCEWCGMTVKERFPVIAFTFGFCDNSFIPCRSAELEFRIKCCIASRYPRCSVISNQT